MTWPEAVDQALCYGWIDGIRKRIDDMTRFQVPDGDEVELYQPKYSKRRAQIRRPPRPAQRTRARTMGRRK